MDCLGFRSKTYFHIINLTEVISVVYECILIYTIENSCVLFNNISTVSFEVVNNNMTSFSKETKLWENNITKMSMVSYTFEFSVFEKIRNNLY